MGPKLSSPANVLTQSVLYFSYITYTNTSADWYILYGTTYCSHGITWRKYTDALSTLPQPNNDVERKVGEKIE